MDTAVHAAVQRAAREAYGRLVAFVSARSHDVAAAEDALSEAFLCALQTWPATGIPDRPEAWLLVAARRRLLDVVRHRQVRQAAEPLLLAAFDEADACVHTPFPDDRLKLMFVCAHPAIDEMVRAPLMLQAVLGLDAARIASAFLVSPAAMGQRLSRAKARIRASGLPYEVPARDELPGRLEAVLDAVYAAYGRGWDDVLGADARHPQLAREALELGALLVRLLPDEPEALGLLALMLYTQSRSPARRDAEGRYVALSEQDPTCWSAEQIELADACLARSASMDRSGRYQLEAAIQSVHAHRLRTGRTDWDAIVVLYRGLLRMSPRLGVLLGHAAATAQVEGPSHGLAWLDRLPAEAVGTHQPYWALRAHLLALLARTPEARAAYSRAIALCEDTAMRSYLLARARELDS